MNVLSLISAVLISAFSPIELPPVDGVKEGYALIVDGQAVVAVIPELCFGYEQKADTLLRAAETLGKEWGKDILLTDDMLTYLILSRMRKRGVSDYERKNLAARLPKIKGYCFEKQKAS